MGEKMSNVSIIAGATGGIGSSLALELAKRRHELALVGKDKEKLINLQKKIHETYNNGVIIKVIDFNEPKESSVKTFFEKVVDNFGKIDNLINCIGICAWQKIEDLPLELWNKILSINLTTSFLLNKYSILYMKKQKKGSIINISSVAGKKGAPYSSAYCAAKAGAILLSQSLAEEVTKEGIKVISLILGSVNTNFIQKGLNISDENLEEYIIQKYSKDARIEPKELSIFIANLIESSDNIMFKEIVMKPGGAKNDIFR